MVIFCADESGCDAELVGTSVSIPRGSRASSLWAGAKVGAVMKTAARKNRYIICMCCLLKCCGWFRLRKAGGSPRRAKNQALRVQRACCEWRIARGRRLKIGSASEAPMPDDFQPSLD